jgi:GNAT superfamily N-acetyltransferase
LSLAALTGRDARAVRVGGVIAQVTEADLPELLPLMRGYCDFYEVAPSDEDLLALSRTLIGDPDQGLQLLARDDDGRATGFATIFWTWSTLSAAGLGVMNDLFVAEDARGGGYADALIAACAERCRERGVTELAWQTAYTNLRAQAVYDRVGAKRDERWLDYSLEVAPGATTPDS